MAAPALTSLPLACILALAIVAAGAARTGPDSFATQLICPGGDSWSDPLCKDVCGASGFSGYRFRVPNADAGDLSQCCCCHKGEGHGCLAA
ncbi:hypothetical protein ACP70R_027431 [Stipagrostis hirtigluma subsp. patula]